MNEEVKRMNLNEFRNEGFLQEVNRLFFHPLGLALEVFVGEDGNVTSLGGIWDYRDDPEGMFFTNDSLSEEKIDNVKKLRASKIMNRITYGEEDGSIFIDGVGVQQKKGNNS